jgi:hypothetical protein
MKVGKGVFVLFALVLAACSTPADPGTLETPGPTPEVDVEETADPSPSPAEPSAQADAFARAYIETANSALTDIGALAEWRLLFLDSCEVCLAGHTTTEQIWNAGQSITGGQLTDWQIGVEESTADGATIVVNGTIEAAEVLSAEGAVIQTFPEVSPVTIVYTASRQTDGAWLMASGQLIQ